MSELAELPPMAPFDPLAPDVMKCPYPHFRAAQADAPVHRVPNAPYYFISRYADVQDVLRRHGDFSSDLTPLFDGMGVGTPFIPSPVLIFADPPVHSRTKPVAARAFGAGRVKALEGKIRETVDRLIDGFIDQGEVNLLEAFAIPLPMLIIAGELGIPPEDMDKFKRWSDEMVVVGSPGSTPAQRAAANEHLIECNAYLTEKFLAKRKAPTNDLMSILATAETEIDESSAASDRPRPLTDDEAISIIQILLVGGNETTTNATLNTMLLLMQNPDIVQSLRDGRVSWPSVIEESLRLESPVQGFWRLTTCDTQISGVRIPKGTLLFISYAAANRDPDQFANPDRLDPARANSKTHLAFATGIHICIGFRLARLELEIGLQRLFERLGNIRLTPGKNDLDDIFVPTPLVRSVKALHLSFDKIAS